MPNGLSGLVYAVCVGGGVFAVWALVDQIGWGLSQLRCLLWPEGARPHTCQIPQKRKDCHPEGAKRPLELAEGVDRPGVLGYVPLVPLAVVESGPDVASFMEGIKTGLFLGVGVVLLFLAVSWLRKQIDAS